MKYRQPTAQPLQTFSRWLFGYRDDLELSARWWHRGCVVLFVLVMVLTILVAWAMPYYIPPFQSDSLVVITSLADYTHAHPEMENAARGFELEAAAMTARRSPNGAVSAYDISENHWFCKGDIPNHVEAFRRWVGLSSGHEIDLTTATQSLSENVISRTCLTYSVNDDADASDVLRVKYTSGALMKAAVKNALHTVIINVAIALILLNGYYRAFIYVIFGKRLN